MLTASALRNDYHYEDDRLNMQNDTGWIRMLETLKGEALFRGSSLQQIFEDRKRIDFLKCLQA